MPYYTTFWDRMEALPPILIRLLAKEGKEPMTTAEIAANSGLDKAKVIAISWSTTWAGIDMPTMKAFLVGCDRDFTDYAVWKKIRNYITNKNATFKYLRRSPEFDKLLKPLSDAYAAHLENQVGG
jgi:hypothetical protein